MPTFTNKLAVFWKGPSWFPGGPRLGLDEYKINVSFVLYAHLSSRRVITTALSLLSNC